MPDNDVIDQAALDALNEMTGGDPAFLAEMIDTYLDDTPGQFAAMRQALAGGQADDYRRAAHSLKSNSANFGALALADLCREMEEKGKAGALDGQAGRLTQAEAEFEKVRQALLALRPPG
jgi:HPt (histidine-containing phosphotransfer) domain-containing protein